MQRELRYGREGVIQLEFPRDAVVATGPASAEPLSDLPAAVTAALCDPLGYPPLRECVVPGDRIAITLDDCVPQADAVITGVLHELLQAGVEAGNCTVVCTSAYEGRIDQLKSAMPEWATDLTFSLHDPANTKSLSYLAASRDGRPIYFNRHIGDADFVVPIAAIRSEDAHDYFGVHTSLFPSFADIESQQRFFARKVDISPKRRRVCREEAEEAAWLLGIQFTVQIIPGSGSSIIDVLAGQFDEVYRDGRRFSDAAWKYESPPPADVVVATIEGDDDQQSWSSVGRAIEAASKLVADDGTIVLCTELAQGPGPALQRLTDLAGGLDETLHELVRSPSFDSSPAAVVAVARERARIFLLSKLNAEQVEDLGMGYVAAPNEIKNLLRGQQSCILLPNAHQVSVVSPSVTG